MLEAKQTPNRINPRKSTARHIKIKLLQPKERKKSGKQPEKNSGLSTKEYLIKLWRPEVTLIIFQALKEKNCYPQILYLEKLLFRNEEGRKKKIANKNA